MEKESRDAGRDNCAKFNNIKEIFGSGGTVAVFMLVKGDD